MEVALQHIDKQRHLEILIITDLKWETHSSDQESQLTYIWVKDHLRIGLWKCTKNCKKAILEQN